MYQPFVSFTINNDISLEDSGNNEVALRLFKKSVNKINLRVKVGGTCNGLPTSLFHYQ